MDKANKVVIGSTRCDYCQAPSYTIMDDKVLCLRHAREAQQEMDKRASEADTVPLKAVPLHLKDAHEQK